MAQKHDIICIGAVLWDIIGRAPKHPGVGGDVAGRIQRLPGGVALNIAMTLTRFGMHPILLTAVGDDAEGRELLAECARMGMAIEHVHSDAQLPTDRYMAIECGEQGVVAAIADAHSLEAAGDRILLPLTKGPFGSAKHPYSGLIALDGNLTKELLLEISQSAAFAAADMRVAPASPGKAERLKPFVGHSGTTIYVNKGEAETLCGSEFDESRNAAEALVMQGFARAVVSDGPKMATIFDGKDIVTALPPEVFVRRLTGAGDTFMAAHIAAEVMGTAPQEALDAALDATAQFISTEDIL